MCYHNLIVSFFQASSLREFLVSRAEIKKTTLVKWVADLEISGTMTIMGNPDVFQQVITPF